MATPWLASSAFLTETDLICLEVGTIFSREQLAIAAWSEERDQERMGYRTQLGTMDIVVWHTTEGVLQCQCTSPIWLTQEQLEQVEALLQAQGFVGTRQEEAGGRRILFERKRFEFEKRRLLDVRLAHRKSERDLIGIVDAFLSDPDEYAAWEEEEREGES